MLENGGRMTPRPVGRPRADVRKAYDPDTLLDVAIQVFNERGYDGTRMEHVAAAAGISKSSIYHHVSSKEELLRRGLDRALDTLHGVLTELPATEGRAAIRLRYIVGRTAEVTIAERSHVTLLVRVHGNSELERSALERRREYDRHVAAIIAEAQRDGDVRTDIEAALLTRLMLGAVVSVVEWYRPTGELAASDIVAALEALLLDGLRANG